MIEVRKPAAWENSTLEDLMTIEAGQAYVLEQFGSDAVKPEVTFRSSRTNQDAASYDVFEDGSLWLHNNAQDVVYHDVSDFVINELRFDGVHWEDTDDRDGMLVDDMDKNLLIYLWDEERAREHFASAGGIVSEIEA